ncbi:MAG: hypothetical protein V1783_06830 [Bacteroidota bacterium]
MEILQDWGTNFEGADSILCHPWFIKTVFSEGAASYNINLEQSSGT